ncbi:2739_t:CDS:2 [Paraglomus brasilianum]|uniref:2739_t:CDS:1 n=1 Tax=Paraglomus brasilianum TaxID=144538 RepID=A0A9N8WGI9_9GLOM|nr:2739_t:CDS:2 [Paraglomus brasilianum]
MPRHSKNNTALSFFTYAESQALDYGTKKQRLGRDSMRNFDACFLCLQRARDPQVRIAPLSSNKKSRNGTKEKTPELSNIDKNAASSVPNTQTRTGTKRNIDEVGEAIEGTNKKQNFHLDGDELRAIAQREHEEALKRLEEQKAEAAKPKLPNFWLPSLTPSADPDEVQTIKLRTVCTASDPEHPISIKALIATKWTEVEDANSKSFVCPSCRRTLTNTIKISLTKPCGHVICSSCVDKFVKKSKKCFVCDVKCKDKDVIDMSGEGTGFASGGGKVVARKFDVAFQ